MEPPAPSAVGLSLEELKRETTCLKCCKPFTQPKLLSCLHCVCASCLTIKEGVRKGLRYIVACPQCGKETELPKSGISSLQMAYFKVHLVELHSQLKKAEVGKEMKCENCSDPNSAVMAHCNNCKHFICSNCIEAHQRTKMLANHRIINLEEYKKMLVLEARKGSSSASSTKSATIVMMCQKHREPLKMYCKTCNVLVCPNCTSLDHTPPRHNCDLVRNLVDSQRSELQQGLSSVRELQSTASQSLSDARSTKEKLSQQRDEMCTTINTSIDELIQQLQERRQKLLTGVEEIVSFRSNELATQLQRLELRVDELSGLIHVCEQTLAHTTEQEFLSLKRHVLSNMKEVIANRQQYAPEKVDPPSLFLPLSCPDEIMTATMAHVERYHSLNLYKTTISGNEARDTEVAKEAHFIIQAKYLTGRACLEKQDVSVQIKHLRSGTLVQASVTPGAELGSYKLSYLPEKRGKYKISIKLGPEEIPSSPFYVTARPTMAALSRPHQVLSHLDWAWGVACSSDREVYVTMPYRHTISVHNSEGKRVRTLGLEGQEPGHLSSPNGIAVDKEGYIYVADGQDCGRLQKFTKSGELVAVCGQLNSPAGILVSSRDDKVYVCDKDSQQIIVFDTNLRFLKTFGELSRSTEGYMELTGSLVAPHSLAEDDTGDIYVSDTDNGCIQVFSKDGLHLRNICHPQRDQFAPTGLCIEEDLLYVCNHATNEVVVLSIGGKFVTSFGRFGQLEGQFHTPIGIAMDVDGFLYVCDHCNGRVQIF